MSEWKKYKLGDAIKFGNGKVRPNSIGKIPVYGGNGILNFCDEANYENETIIIGRVGAYCGAVYYENKPIWVSDNALAVKPKEKFNAKFLFYLLKNLELNQFAEGSSHPLVTQSLLNSIDVLITDDESEQRAIASVLSSLDDKIDLLHRQNRTLEGMAEALFRQWFVEEADEGWEEVKLGDLVVETIGGDWGEENESQDTIPVICLRGVDLQAIKDSGFSVDAPLRYIKQNSLDKRILKENELLLAGSGIGPIGKTLPINRKMLANYPHPVIYSNFCKRLRAESKEIAYFVEFSIYQLYKAGVLEQFHMGTSIPNFNMKGFLNYEIVIPPLEKIKMLSSFLSDWYNKKYDPQIRTLEKLRDTLLPKLMSGEVRVEL